MPTAPDAAYTPALAYSGAGTRTADFHDGRALVIHRRLTAGRAQIIDLLPQPAGRNPDAD
ncbi:hypothetical protein [Streptomyces katsurahamanus]|uniref:Uncharacterized protein n=1 Tax=Streptomyces katsurahamanus TaxID=2577098 RepID=A0ABW9NPN9_9ACTN|nr:hypothetical protein [Streptomyces katsurahamanus]MQS35141.1 hypothetical protein [Streptomyces katsurahamanus]